MNVHAVEEKCGSELVKGLFRDLESLDQDVRLAAINQLLDLASSKNEWAYAVWDDLLADLSHRDLHRRSVSAQLLCRLSAKSDPEGRIMKDFHKVLAVTKDKSVVAARHALGTLWRVALGGSDRQEMVLGALSARFAASVKERNGALVRADIVESLKKLYDFQGEEAVKAFAMELIAFETDERLKKKYARLWR